MGALRIPIGRRFSDLDLLGHVNNVTYHDYLQEARFRLLTHLGRETLEEAPLVVARQEIDYIAPLPGGLEPVVVEVWVDRLGTSSFTVAARIFDSDGTLAARASTVMVFVDPETGASVAMNALMRNRLESGMREEGDDGS